MTELPLNDRPNKRLSGKANPMNIDLNIGMQPVSKL